LTGNPVDGLKPIASMTLLPEERGFRVEFKVV